MLESKREENVKIEEVVRYKGGCLPKKTEERSLFSSSLSRPGATSQALVFYSKAVGIAPTGLAQ